jgi:putative flavoprotein involved in K+ transport
MTTTAQQTEATRTVTTWLADFSAALAANDPAGAAALFTEDCFWRDLISFSWNFRTFEGRAEITAMLEATLSRVRPDGWTVTDGEEPAEAGGITEAWIDFETSVGRGHGHVRLRDGQGWTLLTTLYELKGHEEPKSLFIKGL